ncbi:SH3 and multiple ankyrin repeat domains protein 2 [Orbilia javanica]|uniref:SH3 and multiple ankyrin repeat domains protein 2 n=1 Tax=Orbilia javanica TaxID=47235 RepID=A0AAN8MQP7_9PEZI
MLRTLVHGIIFQHPACFEYVRRFYSDRKALEAARKDENSFDWTRDQLEQMFTTLTSSLTLGLSIYIDALDEGEGFLLSKMFKFLEKHLKNRDKLHGQNSLRICLSSRTSNFVNHRTTWTAIDLGKENAKDIEIYAIGELRETIEILQETTEILPDYGDMVLDICEQIQSKADGVFLWAKIVVGRLQKAMDNYCSVDGILAVLEDSPEDLYSLFNTCLEGVKKVFWPQMVQVLQIVLAAERPLSIEELVDLMRVNHSSNTFHDRPPTRTDDVTTMQDECDQMRNNIQNWCGGLVEVVEAEYTFTIMTSTTLILSKWGRSDYLYRLNTQVRFIHQSVKDYLLRIAQLDMFGLREIEATSQKFLLTWCLRYLEHMEGLRFYESAIEEQGVVYWCRMALGHPFLIYSPFWVKHAENCGLGHLDEAIIHRANDAFKAWSAFPPEKSSPRWGGNFDLGLYRKDSSNYRRIYSSLLSFSANYCFVNLVEALLLYSDVEYEQEQLDKALVSACAQELTPRTVAIDDCNFLTSYSQLDSDGNVLSISDNYWLAKGKMVDLLVEKNADVNVCGDESFGMLKTPLTAACRWGCLSLVKKLVGYGADVNFICPDFDSDVAYETNSEHEDSSQAVHNSTTPLIEACESGDVSIVAFLIRCGAQVDTRAGTPGSALGVAASRGDIGMIELLLDSHATIDMILDADISKKASDSLYGAAFGSALTVASRYGKESAVKYLVSRGAKVNLGCPRGSPLSAAALSCREGGTAIMEYLISKGAFVKDHFDEDIFGSILLSAVNSSAPRGCIPSRIKLLVKHGIDVNAKFTSEEDPSEYEYTSALIAAALKNRFPVWISGSTESNDIETMRCLIELGARVNEQPTTGSYGSALIAATSCSVYERMKFLIENGADVNLPLLTGHSRSPLETVTSKERGVHWEYKSKEPDQIKAIEMLLQNGADADSEVRAGLCRPKFLGLLIPYVKDESLRKIALDQLKEAVRERSEANFLPPDSETEYRFPPRDDGVLYSSPLISDLMPGHGLTYV